MQTLFEWDFQGREGDLLELVVENEREFAPDFEDNGFTHRIIKGVKKYFDEINELITTYAPEWPIDQITVTDRNVLRIGIYELKYSSEVPPKVAINESIELAKTFGGESSGKFVNGVLGTIYKDMEERGEKISTQEAVFTLSKEHSQVNPDTGRVEISAGGVVFRRDNDGKIHFALIKDGYGKWTFPKGHIEEGESLEIAALEEVKEETGLRDLAIRGPLGTNILQVNPKQGQAYEKPVHYFLIETTDTELTPQEAPEITDASWFSQDDVVARVDYDDAKEMLGKACTVLQIPFEK